MRPLTQLPGGGAISFNLDNLTLQDFRQMKDHYQINSSLSVLTFLLHQMQWHIKCSKKSIADQIEENLRKVWTRLIRGMAQSFWAGYSPNILEWDNDVDNKAIVLSKVKDLFPEDCCVHWKWVNGFKPEGRSVAPKVRRFDGITQFGAPANIPVEYSYWYPLLMENGDYAGRKLLRPAFQSWFFSILMHLFANRYYERFGEPTPVGRAPYDDTVTVNGEEIYGNTMMAGLIQQLRNRSVVVLPNDRTPVGQENNPNYDYTLEYMESQMRGADFERYMQRLDEEMSLALFTPILLLRTADVGSYNLGVGHMKVYLWMLNAIAGDFKYYIDKYIVKPLHDWNYGLNAPQAEIEFAPLNNDNQEMLQNIATAMITAGRAKPDLRLLGEIIGVPLEEVNILTEPQVDPNTPSQPKDEPSKKVTPKSKAKTDNQRRVYSVLENISSRIEAQVSKANLDDRLGSYEPSFGFAKQLGEALEEYGIQDAQQQVVRFFTILGGYLSDKTSMGFVNGLSAFMLEFRTAMFSEIDLVLEKM